MGIRAGTRLAKIYLGTNKINKAIVGSEEIYVVYSITPSLTNVTASASNPTTIISGRTATLTFTAASGYNLPSSVSVTGATGTWTQATGTLVLSNPTANVTFTIAGTPAIVTYTITPTLSNVTASASNPSTIQQGGTATLTFTAASGYSLPASVSVTGATGTWTQATGTLVLSNPTGNVSFTISGLAVYSITATTSHVTASASNPTTITEGSTATLTFTADSDYNLPSSVSVTGATGTWTQATGTLVLSNPTGNVSFTITGEAAIPDNALETSDNKIFKTSDNKYFVVATAYLLTQNNEFLQDSNNNNLTHGG